MEEGKVLHPACELAAAGSDDANNTASQQQQQHGALNSL